MPLYPGRGYNLPLLRSSIRMRFARLFVQSPKRIRRGRLRGAQTGENGSGYDLPRHASSAPAPPYSLRKEGLIRCAPGKFVQIPSTFGPAHADVVQEVITHV